MQSRLESLIETFTNTSVGMVGSFLITLATNTQHDRLGLFWTSVCTVLACTLWSLLRGYLVRRSFNQGQAGALLRFCRKAQTFFMSLRRRA